MSFWTEHSFGLCTNRYTSNLLSLLFIVFRMVKEAPVKKAKSRKLWAPEVALSFLSNPRPPIVRARRGGIQPGAASDEAAPFVDPPLEVD